MAQQGINKLSAREVSARTERGHYSDGAGLYLRISQAGTKSWVFR